MKFAALVLLAFSFAPNAFAQGVHYCRARIDPNFSRWDEKSIEAVTRQLDALNERTPHVDIGLAFPRSGHNIRWILEVTELAHADSLTRGFEIQAKVRLTSVGQSQAPVEFNVLAANAVSYQDALQVIIRKAILKSGVETKALNEGCPSRLEGRSPSSEEFTQIRVMTANISSGSQQSYDNGEGLRIMKGLKPDVVMIQEFNYKTNSPQDLMEMILTGFEKGFSYYRENEASDQIPNGIISRFPILTSGEWMDRGMPNRDFAWAQMDIPGDHDLWAISVHLSASKAPVRKQEAEDLVRLIKENIPEKDYVVLGGDFNIGVRHDNIIKIFSEVVFEKTPPTDSKGMTTTNMTNKKNYDWVLTDSDLAAYQVPTQFKSSTEESVVELENSFASGLVFDSSTFPKLDRVEPIQASDSRAQGMQHLAVIKDFRVPAPAKKKVQEEEPIYDIDCR